MMWDSLAWILCNKNDFKPSQASRDACESFQMISDDNALKFYQHPVDRKSCKKISKFHRHIFATHSGKDSQISLAEALVTSRSPPPNMVWFAIAHNIYQISEAQLEMAIADFLHCKNITDQTVKFRRLLHMLKWA